MKKLILSITAGLIVSSAGAVQAWDFDPLLVCHYRMKDRSLCKKFPNFARKKNLCTPNAAIVGSVEWRRRDITKTELDEYGKHVTFDATVVTYRYVYDNGAWGDCFTRIYRHGPVLIEPPLAKGVVASK